VECKSWLPEIKLDIFKKHNLVFYYKKKKICGCTYYIMFILAARNLSLIVIIISSGIPKIIRSYQKGKSKYKYFSPLKWFMTSLLIFIIIKNIVCYTKGESVCRQSWDLDVPRHFQQTKGAACQGARHKLILIITQQSWKGGVTLGKIILSLVVMVNFMYQLDWDNGCPDGY
jgi:hypothetical protein